MKLHTNIHIVTADGLDQIQCLRVPSYQLGNGKRLSDIGKITARMAGYVNTHSTGSLFFVPISPTHDKSVLTAILNMELQQFGTMEQATIPVDEGLWLVEMPRVLYFALKNAISERAPGKTAFHIKSIVTFPDYRTATEIQGTAYQDALQFRVLRLDEHGFAVSFDVVHLRSSFASSFPSIAPIPPGQRKRKLDELVSRIIPVTGLAVHVGGTDFLVPLEPLNVDIRSEVYK